MRAANEAHLLTIVLTSVNTGQFTLEKGPLNAMNVGNPLQKVWVHSTTRMFTQVLSLLRVGKVGNHLEENMTS